MELFKKKEEKKEEVLLGLKAGTLIEISKISDKNMSYSHKTRLEEFLSEKEAIVLVPMSNSNIVKLSRNMKYSIIFKTKNGILKNTMKILSYDIKGSIPLMKIELLEQTEKIQRRASYRLSIGLDFEFDIVDDNDEQTLKSSEILLSKAKTVDISSGGIKFFSNEDLEEGVYIKVLINIDKLFVVAIASIIYKERLEPTGEYTYEYKCRFENIPKKYKEDLSKYIFEVQRDLSKKGRIFNE